MSAINVFFSHNIKLLREFFGHELSYVAKKLAVSPDRYRHWEREESFPSKPHYYLELCALYNFSDLKALFSQRLSEDDLHAYYNQAAGG